LKGVFWHERLDTARLPAAQMQGIDEPHRLKENAEGEIRTPDLAIMSGALSPAELPRLFFARGHFRFFPER
jgi:hypothetical protein